MSKREVQKQALVDLRASIIGKNHTLPFTVYSDENIEDLLNVCPTTMEELVKIKGFPANGKRVKLFGEEILRIFRGMAINTDAVVERVSREFKSLNQF